MITCFILSSIVSYMICICLTPKIELTKIETTLEVGEQLKEPEYKATWLNKDITNLVNKTGKVNQNKLGTYQIEYKIKYLIFIRKKKITINIIDKEAPQIELVGEKEKSICPNKSYEEEGYSAKDNYDGDLTDKVIVTKKENQIIYEVKDSSNNLTTTNRTIIIEDKEKPKIVLKGNNIITIIVNTSYQEPGYTATDNCDGTITEKVQVTGNVDTTKIGSYSINYQVTDNQGNTESITRTIRVINKPSNERGVIYLTFDDGPSSNVTSKILKILREEGVVATFFVINHSDDLNYLIKQEYHQGHTVALHSYTHNYQYIYQSENNFFNDLTKIRNKVKNITGEESNIIRFPGGSSNTISRRYNQGIMTRLTKEVVNRGYHYFDWNVDSNDAGGASSSQEIYNNVIRGLSINRENIVLMHDSDSKIYTAQALKDIIRFGKENGYKFKKITSSTTMITHGVNN